MKHFLFIFAPLLMTASVWGQDAPKYQGKTAAQWAKELQSADNDKMYEAARALAAMGKNAKPALPVITRRLTAVDQTTFDLLAEALVNIGKEAVPGLTTMLRSKDEYARRNAAMVLAKMGPDAKSAASALASILGDSVAGGAALEALGKIGPEAKVGVKAMVATIGVSNSTEQRKLAESILVKLGADAVPRLIESLASRNEKERYVAAEMLAKIGPAAKSAVPALTTALKDKAVQVRESAAVALAQIKADGTAAPADMIRDFAGTWTGTSARNPLFPNDPRSTLHLTLDEKGEGTMSVTNGNPNFDRRYSIKLRGVKDGTVTLAGNAGSLRLTGGKIVVRLGRGADELSFELTKEK